MDGDTLCETIASSIKAATHDFEVTLPGYDEFRVGAWNKVKDSASSIVPSTASSLRMTLSTSDSKGKAKGKLDEKEEKVRISKADERAASMTERFLNNEADYNKALMTARRVILEAEERLRSGDIAQRKRDFASLKRYVEMVLDTAIPWCSADMNNEEHDWDKIYRNEFGERSQRRRVLNAESRRLVEIVYGLLESDRDSFPKGSLREHQLRGQAWRFASRTETPVVLE
jgi:hypothetical protein